MTNLIQIRQNEKSKCLSVTNNKTVQDNEHTPEKNKKRKEHNPLHV